MAGRWLKEYSKLKISNFKCYLKDHVTLRTGVMILKIQLGQLENS